MLLIPKNNDPLAYTDWAFGIRDGECITVDENKNPHAKIIRCISHNSMKSKKRTAHKITINQKAIRLFFQPAETLL